MRPSSLVPVEVRCGPSSWQLNVDISLSVRVLKPILSALLHISPAMLVLHRGEILRGDAPLFQSNVITDDILLVLPLPSTLSLTIRFGDDSANLEVDPLGSIDDLYTAIGTHFSVQPEQFAVIAHGQLLCYGFSVAYYDIPNHSILYSVGVKSAARIRANPVGLVEVLRHSVHDYALSRGPSQVAIANEIRDLIHNPILQSYARIDPEAKQLIDDAVMVVGYDRSRSNSCSDSVVAAMNDLILNQLELSKGGISFMEKGYRRSQNAPFIQIDLPANVDYTAAISEEELPIWWTEEPSSADSKKLHGTETFSKQLRVLKRMGFADEAVILMALRETAGNVPRAAKFLMRTGNHRG
jgi:hypothetical protein